MVGVVEGFLIGIGVKLEFIEDRVFYLGEVRMLLLVDDIMLFGLSNDGLGMGW